MVWITVNLAVTLVIGGIWALAVRALHNGLADPDARPQTHPRHHAAPDPVASPLPGAVRPGRHAA